MTDKEMEVFFKKVEKKAFLIIKMSVKDEDNAFDILQDSMLSFISSYKSKEIEEATPLFYKIVQNKIKDWHRKQILTLKIFFKDEEEEIEPISEDNPLIIFERYRFLSDMQREIDLLSNRQKEVFLLKTIEEFTFKEIAEILSSNENTIKTHYKRAIDILKNKFYGENYEKF